MKINIGPYTSWFGPYQLAEVLCFWAKAKPDKYGVPDKPRWIHQFGELLAHGKIEPDVEVGEVYDFAAPSKKTALYKFLLWLDSKKQRKVNITIHKYDTWNMDSTLALIVVPMLKQLKTEGQGAPYVDDVDVPEELRSTAVPPKKDDWDLDDNHFKRWSYVLDEMIFAFESQNNDWEDQFYTDSGEYKVKKLENGMSELIAVKQGEIDKEGMKAYQKRISTGFALFGKYYEALWT